MVSTGGWLIFAMVALQVYCAAVVLLGQRGHRAARWTLGALFLLNAAATGVGFVFRDVLATGAPSESRWFDLLSNGALILAAEYATADLVGRPAWTGAWGVALLAVVGDPVWAAAGGQGTFAFVLMTYAYAAVRISGSLWSTRGSPRQAGLVWLAAAFFPRFLELAPDGMYNTGAIVSAIGPVTVVLGAVILIAAATAVHALRAHPGRTRLAVAVVFMAAGLLLGATRVLTGGASDIVTVYLTLAVIRPLAILAGMSDGSLFGKRFPITTMVRHGALALAAACTFGLVLAATPGVIPTRGRLVDALFAAAVSFVLLPMWALVSERLPSAKPGDEARPAASAPPATASAGALPPGLDPACRFGSEEIGAYERARPRAAGLSQDRRAALAALTRRERILLALQGSSREGLGDTRFTQAGLQWATHIPYRYLSTVVREANAPGPPLVVFSSGVRGLRHYWLSPVGAMTASRLATDLGLEKVPDVREVLGEAFHRAQSLEESTAP